MTESTLPPSDPPPARPRQASAGRRDLREIREALLLLHQQLDAFQADAAREHDDWEEERIRLRQERDELRRQVEALRGQGGGAAPTSAMDASPVPQTDGRAVAADRSPPTPSCPAAAEPAAVSRTMSAALMVGWISLFAGVTVHLLAPQALFGVLFPLATALVLGIATLLRRQTALVYGLLGLTVATPSTILWAEASLDFNGLLAPHRRPAAAPQAPAGDAGPAASAPLRIGDAALIDRVRVRFNGVTAGPVEIRDVLGRTGVSQGHYLQIHLTLTKEGGASVFAKRPWEKSRLVDDRDNSFYVVGPQRSSLDQVIGAIDSAELEPGLPMPDRMVFPLPSEEAGSFTVVADPGFYEAGDNGLLQQVSGAPVTLAFTRDDIGGR